MSDEKRVIYVRYTGEHKSFFIGVPAEDLTKDEFDALSPENKRDVLASTIYELAEAPKKSAKADESENN